MRFAGGIAMVALCYYAKKHLGARIEQLGLITLLGSLVYVACCPVFGLLSERYGRRPFIVVSTLVFGSAYFSAYFSTQVWHLYLVTAVSGLGHALFWPSVEAELAADADTHQLRQRVGRLNISWGLGEIAAAMVAGVALDLRPALPFLICAGTGVGISSLTSLLRMSSHSEEDRARHLQTVNGHQVPANHVAF